MLPLPAHLLNLLENRAVLLVFALVFDLVAGEPPECIHPVVWFGKLISLLERMNRGAWWWRFAGGVATTLIVAAFALLLSFVPRFLPFPVDSVVYIYLLKSSFSIRAMLEHVDRIVESDFSSSHVQMVVSRRAEKLSYWLRCSAVIESVAENFVDSVLSPLFYYVLFGLSGALVYRAVNTCDSMLGYRDEEHFWFGKFAARLDDALNFLPARLSVILTAIVSGNLEVLRALREGISGKVNGCSMIAFSYALGLRLEKPGYYALNENGRLPGRDDVLRAEKLFLKLAFASCALAVLLLLLLEVYL